MSIGDDPGWFCLRGDCDFSFAKRDTSDFGHGDVALSTADKDPDLLCLGDDPDFAFIS